MILKLNNPEVLNFIQQHQQDDPAVLALQAKKFPALPIREIAVQIASRKKARKKLPEWWANSRVIFPPQQNLEQASGEEAARFKSTLVGGGSLLDLTGGTGIDAFYLSENFEQVTVVEPVKELCELIRHNFAVFDRRVEVVQSSAKNFLKSNHRMFDQIYVDPSRRTKSQQRIFDFKDYAPNIPELMPLMLQKFSKILVKASPMIDLRMGCRELGGCRRVVTLAVRNEMKEILYDLERDLDERPVIHAVNLEGKRYEIFEFNQDNSHKSIPELSRPLGYIYEPNSAIRKAGLYDELARVYRLKKLHPNTHLYTSQAFHQEYPGKIFGEVELIKQDKKTIKQRFPNGLVNVISKNYPLGTNELKKKYRLNDGGTEFLVFCEISQLGKTALVCTRK
jgi:hypothetical protein